MAESKKEVKSKEAEEKFQHIKEKWYIPIEDEPIKKEKIC